jgi:hypothetical protein
MASPYNDRRYGGALSATRGFLDAFKEYQEMRWKMRQSEIMTQYRQSLMAQHRDVTEKRGLDIDWAREKHKVYGEMQEPGYDPSEHPEHRMFVTPKTEINLLQPRSRKDYRTIAGNALTAAKVEGGKISNEEAQKAFQWYMGEVAPETEDERARAKSIFDNVAQIGWQDVSVEWPEKEPEGKPSLFDKAKGLWKYSPIGGVISGAQKLYGPQEKPETEPAPEFLAKPQAEKEWIPDDVRYYREPPGMEGKIGNWTQLSESIKKKIWTRPYLQQTVRLWIDRDIPPDKIQKMMELLDGGIPAETIMQYEDLKQYFPR